MERRLTEKNERESLNLNIKFLPIDTFDFTTKMAKSIGQQVKDTNIVIWGIDSKPKECSHKIIFKYVMLFDYLNEYYIPSEGKTKIFETMRLLEISEGELNLEIENIIFWILGTKSHFDMNFNKALNYFNKLNDTDYSNFLTQFFISDCYINLGLINEGKKHIESAIEMHPRSSLLHVIYAELLEDRLKDYTASLAQYDIAVELNPKNHITLNQYGVFIYNKLKDFYDANKYFKKALQYNPFYDEANYNYAYLQYYDFKKIHIAKKYFEEVLRINPNYFLAHYHYGGLIEKEFDDIKGAKEHYENALRINPNYYKALNRYANLLYKKFNDIKGAKEHYENALRIEPDYFIIHFNYAVLLFREFEDIKGAKEHYKEVSRIEPDFIKILFNYASILKRKLNKKTDVKENIEEKLNKSPKNALTHSLEYDLLLQKYDDIFEILQIFILFEF